MKRLVLVTVATLLVFPALAVAGTSTMESAATAQPTIQAAVIVRAVDQAKGVPRGDKDSVEIIGTVAESYSITDPCSGTTVGSCGLPPRLRH
jgi:hypothetical protein